MWPTYVIVWQANEQFIWIQFQTNFFQSLKKKSEFCSDLKT